MAEVLRLVGHPQALHMSLALLHFLWQGAALAIIAVGLLAALRKASAAVRYLVLLSVLAAMAVCPIITFGLTARAAAAVPPPVLGGGGLSGPQGSDNLGSSRPGRLPMPPLNTQSTPLAASALQPENGQSPRPSTWAVRAWMWGRSVLLPTLPWISLLWVAGVVVLSLRFLMRGWALWRLGRSLRPAAEQWQETFRSISRRLALSRPVKLMVSAAARVPMVIGWLRPAVVIPASALTGLTPEQLTALLAHELAHIRRHDQSVNLAQTLVELLLFYHPAVWWVSRAIRAERENCCDDMVVALSGDAATYMRALAWVEEHRGVGSAPALASSGSPLLGRIRRLGGYTAAHDVRHTWAAAALALAVVAAILIGGAVSGATAATDADQHQFGLREQWQPKSVGGYDPDRRIEQPVHIEILGRAAIPALALLSEKTGVSLLIAPEDLETVGERKFTVIAQGCSLKAIMVQLPKALQECHWDIVPSSEEPVYLLHRNGGAEATMVQLIDEEPALLAEGTRPAREARIADARAALAMSPDELKELAKTDPLLAAAAKDPETRRWMELFVSLPADQMEEFSRTGWLPTDMPAASPALQEAVRDHAASRYQEAKQKNEHPEFWQAFTEGLDDANLTYQDTDRYATNNPIGWGICLLIDATTKSGASYGDTTLLVPPRGPGRHVARHLRALLVRTGLDGKAADALLADLQKQSGQERLEARDQKRQREWREPQSLELHKEVVLPFTDPVDPVQVQQFLAKETGLSFVSDYFTTRGPRPIPEEARAKMPVWRLLYLLGEYWFWTYNWNEAGDCLVFHDRTWCSSALKECPESLLTAFRERLAKQGALTLNDAAAFAMELDRRRPRNPKLRKKFPMVPSDLKAAGLSGHAVGSEVLLLYATLTPEQKVQAGSDAGLAYGEMTPAQQARVAHIGQKDNNGRPLPDGELAQAVFRVKVSHEAGKQPTTTVVSGMVTFYAAGGPQDIHSLAVEFPSRRVAITLRLRPAPSRP